MAVLSLIGITGMYLRQVKQTGVLGLLGYLVFAAGYLIMMSIEVVGAVVLPALAHSAPGYSATSTTSSPSLPAATRPATSA